MLELFNRLRLYLSQTKQKMPSLDVVEHNSFILLKLVVILFLIFFVCALANWIVLLIKRMDMSYSHSRQLG